MDDTVKWIALGKPKERIKLVPALEGAALEDVRSYFTQRFGNAPDAPKGCHACNECFTRGCEEAFNMYEEGEDGEEEGGGDGAQEQWT